MLSALTKIGLASLLCFSGIFNASAAPQIFHVATFNVENYLDAPTANRPAKSAAAQAQVLASLLAIKPDVLALEEMGSTNMLLRLQAALKAGGCDLPYWEEINGWDTNIHVAVLSRFPITARQPLTNDLFLLDGKRFPVRRGFAKMDIQVNPHYAFTLIAAHLKSRLPSLEADEEEIRYAEAKLLRHYVDKQLQENPLRDLLVLGDFNDLKDSKSIRTIMGRSRVRLFDTRPAERNGDEPAHPGQNSRRITWTHYYSVEDTFSRIDYILLNQAMEEKWLPNESYLYASPNWGLASDHRPVVAGFRVENR